MKHTHFIIIALIGLLVVAGCSAPQQTTQQTQNQKIIAAATFWPLYDLTKDIVGDKGTVYSIVPTGVEPHSYEPSPGDIQKLNNADVFVSMGIEFEEFEEDLVDAVNPNVKVIAAGKGIRLLKISDDHGHEEHDDEHEEEEHEEEGHEDEHEEEEHAHSGEDPHIWLSPKNAQKMVLNVMKGLVEADSANGEYYLQNGQKLIDNLKELDQEFKGGLASCDKDVILVNHNAFSYLGRDYGFSTIEISGLKPEAEPTPKQLAELIEEAEEHDLKFVFYEELVDSRIAKTIANEVGAEVLALSPVASDLSVSYDKLMRNNLQNLRVALECQ